MRSQPSEYVHFWYELLHKYFCISHGDYVEMLLVLEPQSTSLEPCSVDIFSLHVCYFRFKYILLCYSMKCNWYQWNDDSVEQKSADWVISYSSSANKVRNFKIPLFLDDDMRRENQGEKQRQVFVQCLNPSSIEEGYSNSISTKSDHRHHNIRCHLCML